MITFSKTFVVICYYTGTINLYGDLFLHFISNTYIRCEAPKKIKFISEEVLLAAHFLWTFPSPQPYNY